MSEVDEAAKIISAAADPDANIIFGAAIDDSMKDQMKITVIATGFDNTKQKLKEFVSPFEKPVMPTPAPVSSGSIPNPFSTPVSQPSQPEPVMSSTPPKQEEEDDDVFEIPAFLRQRN
jgi:cell division protein FtsZ